MGRPSQPRKNREEALRLYNSRNTNGLSVKDIVTPKLGLCPIVEDWKMRKAVIIAPFLKDPHSLSTHKKELPSATLA